MRDAPVLQPQPDARQAVGQRIVDQRMPGHRQRHGTRERKEQQGAEPGREAARAKLTPDPRAEIAQRLRVGAQPGSSPDGQHREEGGVHREKSGRPQHPAPAGDLPATRDQQQQGQPPAETAFEHPLDRTGAADQQPGRRQRHQQVRTKQNETRKVGHGGVAGFAPMSARSRPARKVIHSPTPVKAG
ncbi:MAG: hypothetical protein HYV75_06190 [Opitutae bacterium]|nr:hypothetical protein [Opitutae bacterium]